MSHPIHELLDVSLEHIEHICKANTIIGDPIVGINQSIIILPVSKVKVSFLSGGSDLTPPEKFGGATTGGVTITPIAFLVLTPTECKTLLLENKTHLYEILMDLVPDLVEKIQELIHKNESKEEPSSSKLK